MSEKLETIKPTEAQVKARRSRSIAIGIALGLFVILVYAVSIFKLGPGVLDRPM